MELHRRLFLKSAASGLFAREEPAILVCHWSGIYYNSDEIDFNIVKEVVRRLHSAYDNLQWMKLSEVSCYAAAKELTEITRSNNSTTFQAPFASPQFRVSLTAKPSSVPKLSSAGQPVELTEVRKPFDLKSGTWFHSNGTLNLCFDLPKGKSVLTI